MRGTCRPATEPGRLPRRGSFLFLFLAAPFLWGSGLPGTDTPPAGKSASPPKASFGGLVAPFLKVHCLDCHSGDKRKGGIALDRFGAEPSVPAEHRLWGKVLSMLEKRKMPPPIRPRPAPADVEAVAGWIHAGLEAIDCNGPVDPGRPTIRRLNRAEYNNTIRDLLALDFRPAEDFPADDVGYGFDNIGDVLSIPPILMEKYLSAAEDIVEKAIVPEPRTLPRLEKHEDSFLKSKGASGPVGKWAHALDPGGETRAKQVIAEEAEYILRARVFGQGPAAEPIRMSLRVDGKELQVFEVKARESSPRVYEARARLQPGERRLQVVFLDERKKPEKAPEKSPGKAKPSKAAKTPPRKDPKLVVEHLSFEGPLDAKPKPLPESHRRAFGSEPAGPNKLDHARKVLEAFAGRAFRRPAQKSEVDRLLKLVAMAFKNGEGLERAIQPALQAVLVSPHFLFRVEVDRGPPGAVVSLEGHELASRLSYFLWSSMPDEELLARAADGSLQKDDVLEAQARRMLKDPRSRALVENFAGQWLQVRILKNLTPDATRFPSFNEDLRSAMQRETEMLFAAVLEEDRSVLEFIDSDYTFLNELLARHYGIEGVRGKDFRRVKLAGGMRGGVLTHASILTITSNPTRTSPVKRGKWVLEQILGDPPPPPPPGVDDLKDDEAATLAGTLRQRMEAHRKKADCASCHARMDALGFGLENFDPVGAWREKDGPFPVDPSGTLPSGVSFRGPAELKAILMKDRQGFLTNLAGKMLTFALGRGLEYHDRCAVEKAVEAVTRDGYKLQTLVVEVVRSVPFRMRRNGGSSPAEGKP